MLEVTYNEKRNILTPLNPRKTKFLGLVERITKSPFSALYDEKREITMYFNLSGNMYVISEKQEFLNGEMVRIRHNSDDKNIIIKNKKKSSDFKQITTRFLVPKTDEFTVKVLNKPEFKENKRMQIYGNEWFYFVKDDGFDNEKLFGIFLDNPTENGLEEVSDDIFAEKIEKSFC